mgnify:CR=1 FL=1
MTVPTHQEALEKQLLWKETGTKSHGCTPEPTWKVSKRILFEIDNRLGILNKMSLGYLSLNRMANTLSGGEAQRIKLTRSLGSNLTASMYILDEPSIGLHPKDTLNLIEVLRELRDLGNTIVVIEHDEDVIKSADYLIDIGPNAGRFGGEVVFAGDPEELENSQTLTAQYLREERTIALPKHRRKAVNHIYLKGSFSNSKQCFVSYRSNSRV